MQLEYHKPLLLLMLNRYKTVTAGCQEFGIPAGRAADLLR